MYMQDLNDCYLRWRCFAKR